MILDKNRISMNSDFHKNCCNVAHLKLTHEEYLKTQSGNFSILVNEIRGVPPKNILLKSCYKVSNGYVSKEKLIDVQINFWDFEIIDKDTKRDIIIGEILN